MPIKLKRLEAALWVGDVGGYQLAITGELLEGEGCLYS